jgi:hypothetical protein
MFLRVGGDVKKQVWFLDQEAGWEGAIGPGQLTR